jgi:hypothetical protein
MKSLLLNSVIDRNTRMSNSECSWFTTLVVLTMEFHLGRNKDGYRDYSAFQLQTAATPESKYSMDRRFSCMRLCHI